LKNYANYQDFPWCSSRLIKRSFHHRLWRLPYTEVLVCHKQRVEVFHSNLSIERSWVPFRCWVSLFLTGFTSVGSLQSYELSLPSVKKVKTIAFKASKKKVEVLSEDGFEDEEKAVGWPKISKD